MAKFLMLGKYSAVAVKGISSERTKKVEAAIKRQGGRVLSMFALLGRYDLALLVELPSVAAALKVSVAIAKMTGIGFTTAPAIPVAEFDKLMR